MNHPVEALQAVRASLAEGGSVVVGDERVADRFTAPGDELERFNYGWSILHCLTVGMLDHDSAGTGTVLRAAYDFPYLAHAAMEALEFEVSLELAEMDSQLVFRSRVPR